MRANGIYKQVAELHAACIDQGFLSKLGVPFLALMYRSIDEAADAVLLVEMRDGKVCGFVSGGAGMSAIYRCMFKRPVRLAWALLPSLVRPSRIRYIADILQYRRRQPKESHLPKSELLSIAVDPSARGSGIAESLYLRLVEHFNAQGVSAFRITVGEALTTAHRFYKRMGALPAGQMEVHANQPSTIYVHTLR